MRRQGLLLVGLVLAVAAGFLWSHWRQPARPPAASAARGAPAESRQAVLVYLDSLTITNEAGRAEELSELEAELAQLVQGRAVGEYRGHQFGEDGTVLFFYGPDADRIYDALVDALRDRELTRHARVVVRYGPPGAAQREEKL